MDARSEDGLVDLGVHDGAGSPNGLGLPDQLLSLGRERRRRVFDDPSLVSLTGLAIIAPLLPPVEGSISGRPSQVVAAALAGAEAPRTIMSFASDMVAKVRLVRMPVPTI